MYSLLNVSAPGDHVVVALTSAVVLSVNVPLGNNRVLTVRAVALEPLLFADFQTRQRNRPTAPAVDARRLRLNVHAVLANVPVKGPSRKLSPPVVTPVPVDGPDELSMTEDAVPVVELFVPPRLDAKNGVEVETLAGLKLYDVFTADGAVPLSCISLIKSGDMTLPSRT